MNKSDKERLDFLEQAIQNDEILMVDADAEYDVEHEEQVSLFTVNSQWVYAPTLREAIDKAMDWKGRRI